MRSSNCRHLAHADANSVRKHARPAKKVKISKLGSIIVTSLVVLTAVVIPSITLIQNVEAVTNAKKTVFSIGGSDTFKDVVAPTVAIEEETVKVEKSEKEVEKKAVKKAAKVKATEPETEAVTEEETTEPETEAETETEVLKNDAPVSTANVDTGYTATHVELSAYDRDLLERLVMGEGGSLGFNGAALIAQAVRDSMVLSGTNSVEYIIANYQYDGSTAIAPSEDVKAAVSFIFDSDGCAVQHRILYFYAADMVSNAWHESQQFITSYGNVRFFDQW